MHFNLASSTVWSTTFLCVYWPCFYFLFSLSSFSVPLSLFFCFKTPHFNSCQLTARPMTNCSFCRPLPSATPVTTTTTHPSSHLPHPLSPIWTLPTNWKHDENKNIGISSVTLTNHHLSYHNLLSSTPSSSVLFSLLSHAVQILSSSYPLFILFVPHLLSFLHGTVAFLWTSLPVACGHVLTPLHCPPLRSVSFPLSPVPYPPMAPCPAAPPAVSKERYATLPLYSFRYVIILSSPFLLLLLPRKVGMSCLMLLALFFNNWWLVIRLQGYEGWGCWLFGVCITCFGCCGFVWGK